MTQTITAPATSNVKQRVQELLSYIRNGRIIEAMTEFYAPDSEMQENRNPPTKGLAANIEREKQFLANIKEWRGFNVHAVAVEGDVSLVETSMEFVATDGTTVRLEQVSVSKWRDGKIVHERFYYDSAK